MQTFVARAGQHMGGYNDDELRTLYDEGELLPTDNYWRDGMTEWGTLGDLLSPGEWEPAPAPLDDEVKKVPSLPGWILPTAIVIVLVIVGVVITVSYFSHEMTALPPVNQPPTLDALQQQKFPVDAPKPAVVLPPTENADTRSMNAESAVLLKEIENRSQACRDAEKDMLLLGFNPASLSSLDEIEKRRQSIQLVLPRVQSMVDYLGNLDKIAHDDLVVKGVSPAEADNFVTQLHQTGHQDALTTYWKQEAAISLDMLSNLDLLKANYGKWHVDNDTVVFNDNAMLAAYRANVDKLKVDIAAQQEAQATIQQANPATPPSDPMSQQPSQPLSLPGQPAGQSANPLEQQLNP